MKLLQSTKLNESALMSWKNPRGGEEKNKNHTPSFIRTMMLQIIPISTLQSFQNSSFNSFQTKRTQTKSQEMASCLLTKDIAGRQLTEVSLLKELIA